MLRQRPFMLEGAEHAALNGRQLNSRPIYCRKVDSRPFYCIPGQITES
jgi:hypothetical protein